MIYLVKNVKTNKEYALKKILCKNLNEIIKHKNQLELIYSMKHHNIMKIYYLQFKYLDLTTYSLYIIMERAIGDWSLDIRKRILTKKYYKEYEIINILKQVVSALVYLEERKIAHRDVKPQNILIFPGKIYKVADLGEAKNIENINREITLRGSELYMSPLVYQRHKLNKKGLIHNVFKSDVFSLGYSTLYAICLDLNVIEDIREMTDMKKIVNNIDKYFNRKLFSDRLYRLIINMIEIDENKRYSFKEIERELQKW
jgi:serine/threonine protein kinase